MIDDKLQGFIVYDQNATKLGVAEVTLPELAHMTDTISGAGIAGEVDTTVIGNYGSLTTTLTWRNVTPAVIQLSAPDTQNIDCRGSVQMYDQNTGRNTSQAVKVVMSVQNKSTSLGNMVNAASMGTTQEFEVTYIKIQLDGATVTEIDKWNYICVINGVDYMEDTRRALGLN